MATTSDKARFYLEQQVPELKEYERKKIFTKDEIHTISLTRSSHEHKLCAPQPTASDFARYATYELNLDRLRRLRIQRLGIKHSNHFAAAGQRRVQFILERGVRKLPGDLGLWMQYLETLRGQRAWKKLEGVLMRGVRMHPRVSGLWLWGAKVAVEEHGDVRKGRAWVQRGLRFCGGDRGMWVGFGRVEMVFLGKVWGRRRVLGLDGGDEKKKEVVEEEDDGREDKDKDMLRLPGDDEPEDHDRESAKAAAEMHSILNTPALTGAIPMAIYDAAIQRFPDDSRFALAFFDMVAEFAPLVGPEVSRRILGHIVGGETVQRGVEGGAPEAMACWVKEPVAGGVKGREEVPGLVRETVRRWRECQRKDGGREVVAKGVREVLATLKEMELDEGVRKVVDALIVEAQKEEREHADKSDLIA